MAQNSLPAFPSSAFPQLLTSLMHRQIDRVNRVMSGAPLLRCSICEALDSDASKVATVGGEPFCYHCAQEVCG